jgi:hypothetical protein
VIPDVASAATSGRFLTDDSCSIQLLREAVFKPEPPETGCSSGTIEAALTAIAISPQG